MIILLTDCVCPEMILTRPDFVARRGATALKCQPLCPQNEFSSSSASDAAAFVVKKSFRNLWDFFNPSLIRPSTHE